MSAGISPPTIAMSIKPRVTARQHRRVFSTCSWTVTSGCLRLNRSARHTCDAVNDIRDSFAPAKTLRRSWSHSTHL